MVPLVLKYDIQQFLISSIELAAKALVIGEPIKGVAEYGRWRCPNTIINIVILFY